ncbi:unnamed protein product, partial [marine sediment metagenome]
MRKLQFGSGRHDKHSEGYENCDIRDLSEVDHVIDVGKELPFEDNSIDEILAQSVLEHIRHNIIGVPDNFRMSNTIK